MATFVIQTIATCQKHRLLARSSTGRIWAAFLWASDVYVAFSDDAGATWALIQASVTIHSVYYPTIAIDSSDHLHIVWRQRNSGEPVTDYRIIYQERDANGALVIEEELQDFIGYNHRPTIVVDSSDNPHVVWESITTLLPMIHLLRYRMKTGGVWQPTDILGQVPAILTFLANTCIAIDSNDNIHIVWCSQGWGAFPGGYNLQYEEKIAGVWQGRLQLTDLNIRHQVPSLAVDSNDDLHLMFMARGYGVNVGVYNVQYMSRVSGVWGVPEQVTDVATDQSWGGSASYPTIALDIADIIYVAWSAAGWGVNIAARNVQLRRKIGVNWQAQQGLTDRTTHQGSPSLIWAMFPLVGIERTNIPLTGYAFLLSGDLFGTDQVEYGPAPTLSWGSPAPAVINKSYALAREEL